MGWVAGGQQWCLQWRTTRSLSALEDRADQGIFYLHIMALHAERDILRVGVGTTCLPSFLLLSFLLLLF